MDGGRKREAHRRFSAGDQVVMCATIAFGMGIDRPDVRWVAHSDLPRSPESWYQEIGRAGATGFPARALLLYAAGDIALARHRIEDSPAGPEQKRIERQRLEAMVAIAEAATCRRALLLRCFGEAAAERCGNCDVCLSPPRLFDGTQAAQKLLSAVVRTRLPSGGHFGLGHVVDVLRGRLTDKVAQFAHDRLPTFGVGKDQPEPVWRNVARQLVAQGMLDVAVENHGELVPTEAARPVLRGERTLMLREDTLSAPRGRGGRTSGPREPGGTPPDSPAFAALREWRKTEAQAQAVPAYVIFHDRTLARSRPGAPAASIRSARSPAWDGPSSTATGRTCSACSATANNLQLDLVPE
jgi:ATP-dependent DNA helicase RecQ